MKPLIQGALTGVGITAFVLIMLPPLMALFRWWAAWWHW